MRGIRLEQPIRAWLPVEPLTRGLRASAGTAASSATPLEQAVKPRRLSPVVLVSCLAGHPKDHVVLLGETLLPRRLVREGCQDLGRNRILLLRRQRADLFEGNFE
jgi:hypothetical protein